MTRAAPKAVVVIASHRAEISSAGVHPKHHTIVATVRNTLVQPDFSFDLVDDATFSEGLHAMNLTAANVSRYRTASGMLQTVLRRCLATDPMLRVPPWQISTISAHD